jgi:PD-(D/E)XK endonuclease
VGLTTDQKGTVAETAIVFAAVKLGIDVYRPIGEGGRYDMIFDVGQRLLRVQCKYAPLKDDVVLVRCRRARRTANGLLPHGYTADEIDAFAAYCPELDRSFFLPIENCRGRLAIQLRVSPARNNQTTGIEWADDFDFAATLVRLGAVAQLGERERGTLEVTGSIPVGSTSELRTNPELFSFPAGQSTGDGPA